MSDVPELTGHTGLPVQPKVLDVFAGAGGFSLGFEMAGYEIIGGIERDKWAAETFAYNHPTATTIQSEIENVRDSEILTRLRNQKLDVLVGGPPCQGFSICKGKSGDPADPRNSLFEEFIRVARLLSPRLVVMENVPNLMNARTASNEPVLGIIEAELRQIGYHVYWAVLHAAEFGVPQIRKRLFVVGSKVALARPFPQPTHAAPGNSARNLFQADLPEAPTLWEAISDLPPLKAREGSEVSEYTTPPANDFQRLMRSGSHAVFNHKAMNHTPRMVRRFESMSWGDSINDVPNHLRPYRRNTKEISENLYDQNNRRMHPERLCHTIPAAFYANFVHPFQQRNFTAREGARIQSFPDRFVFRGKPTVVSNKLLGREGRDDENFLCQYAQIGNAVPPLLAQALASHLYAYVFQSESLCTVTATI